MSPQADFASRAPFELRAPPRQRVPFVFNSPHSGSVYPDRFLAMSRLDGNAIRRSEDCFVDELFSGALMTGAPMLVAHFPRAYLDANREPLELDPRMFFEQVPAHANTRSARVAGGLGTVPRVVGEGQDIYSGRLPLAEAMGRIEHVYRPYHDMLRKTVARTHAAFGQAVLIDCHSMPASVRVGETGMRPDFIIGDRYGSSADLLLSDHAIGLLVSMGYTVAHNKPYAGGFITEHYGRPARNLHALQIEVNRGLYMNERTYERSASFDALAADLTLFVQALTRWRSLDAAAYPLAAE